MRVSLMLVICLTTVWAIGSSNPKVDLPGERDVKLPISRVPFPDRMSAYVWRNWMLMPHDRLARVVSAKGCSLMEGAAPEKELDLFRGEWMDFASCADQARFVLARNRGDKVEMRRLAQAELARAKRFLPIVRADSRIGFESSNHYFYVPIDVVEKIVGCRTIIDALSDV